MSGRAPAAGARQDRSYDRGPRPAGGGTSNTSAPAPRRGTDEWSEVPPELEAQLMAQIASKPVASRPADGAPDVTAEASTQVDAPKPKATRKPAASRTTAKAAATDADGDAPKPKATRKPAASKAATAATETADAAPKKRTTTRKPATASAADTADAAAADAPAKKPRAPRKAPTA